MRVSLRATCTDAPSTEHRLTQKVPRRPVLESWFCSAHCLQRRLTWARVSTSLLPTSRGPWPQIHPVLAAETKTCSFHMHRCTHKHTETHTCRHTHTDTRTQPPSCASRVPLPHPRLPRGLSVSGAGSAPRVSLTFWTASCTFMSVCIIDPSL